jgi:hypothetical protein
MRARWASPFVKPRGRGSGGAAKISNADELQAFFGRELDEPFV